MRTIRTAGWTLGVLAALTPMDARGDVTDAAPSGFVVTIETEIAATPQRVYDALVRQVGSWWDPDHTYSGDAANLSIRPRAGGCFCERLDRKGEVRHLTVVLAQPGELLRMTGGLGPLQGLPVSGSLTLALEREEGGTTLTLTYRVAGYDPAGLELWASPVDQVLSVQMRRLQRFIETGTPEG